MYLDLNFRHDRTSVRRAIEASDVEFVFVVHHLGTLRREYKNSNFKGGNDVMMLDKTLVESPNGVVKFKLSKMWRVPWRRNTNYLKVVLYKSCQAGLIVVDQDSKIFSYWSR